MSAYSMAVVTPRQGGKVQLIVFGDILDAWGSDIMLVLTVDLVI